MSLVLAIDPEHTQSRMLARLTRELPGHEILVTSSSDEALEAMEQRVPDLVLFPLLLAPDEEAALTSRLRHLPGRDRIHTLAIPLLAAENGADSGNGKPGATNSRWFYWFKPQNHEEAEAFDEAHVFAEEIRAYLDIERPVSTVPSSVGVPLDPAPVALQAPEPASLPLPDTPPTQPFSIVAFGEDIGPRRVATHAEEVVALGRIQTPKEEIETSEEEPPEETREHGPSRWISGATAAFTFARQAGAGLVRAGVWLATRLAVLARARPAWPALPRVSAPRWVWYGTPVIALAAGVTFSVGLPGRLPWPTSTLKSGTAELRSIPDGADVLVDGNKLGRTPLSAALSAGSHEVEFRYRGARRTQSIEIAAGESTELRIDWRKPLAPPPVPAVNPPTVAADAKRRGATPPTGGGTAAPTIGDLSVGWLRVFSPVELQISDGGRKLALDEKSRVMLSAGVHELQLVNSVVGYRGTQVVEVLPGKVVTQSIVLPKTMVTITASAPSEVWIDGQKVGDTPLVDLPVDLGTRDFVLKNATLGERHVTTTVTVKPLRIDIDFSKPEA